MYNIVQLNDKSLSELQSIAQELGITQIQSFKKEDLVYKILDEQAIAGAAKKSESEKNKEPRKRSRIAKKDKSENVKVYTANQDKAEKVEEPKKTSAKKAAAAKPAQDNAAETTAKAGTETPADDGTPKKRGRKPGSKNKATLAREKAAQEVVKADAPATPEQEVEDNGKIVPLLEELEPPA